MARRYKGCELTSPTYRKVAAEMARNKSVNKDYQPYKQKVNAQKDKTKQR